MKSSLQLTSLAFLALTWCNVASAQTDNPFGEIELPPAQSGQPGAQPTPPAPAPAPPPSATQAPPMAPPPPPPQPAAPPAYNSASSYELNSNEGQYANPEPNPHASPKRSGLVFVPRLGLLLSGRATMHSDIKCPDSFKASSPFRNTSDPFCNPVLAGFPDEDGFATESSSLLVGADLLYHVAPAVRIGGSAMWTPATEVSVPTPTTDVLRPVRMGADVSLDLTVEHLYADNGKSALFYRVMAGPSLMLTGGDLDNVEKAEKEVCRDSLKVCEFGSGVYPGYNLGAGLGALFPIGTSALRTDLLLNYVSLPFRSVSATVANSLTGKTADATIDEDVSFVRLWFSVGTEM